MRVLVCGGRDFEDWERVKSVLNQIHEDEGIDLLIEGGAQGADRLGREWARLEAKGGCDVETFEADWDAHRKAAGPIRNKLMLDEGKPDLVVAFPGGAGTRNMIRQAQAAGVEVRHG